MKKHLLLVPFLAASTFLQACSSETDGLIGDMPVLETGIDLSAIDASLFPVKDGEKSLYPSDRAKSLCRLMEVFDPNRALSLGTLEITDDEFAQIKAFVDENLAADTQKATYENIFKWIRQNIKVAGQGQTAYLRPYDVFTYRTCVCQGYANLFKAMCLTQNIPCIIANGYLGTIGGHAWNYLCADGTWYVCDPTNGGKYTMLATDSYKNSLIPYHSEIPLFEDEMFYYNFEEGVLNVSGVKEGAPETITIPYGVAGYCITSFNLLSAIPATVKTIYIGANITAFSPYTSTMREYTPSVEAMHIDPKNRNFEEYEGAIYKKGSTSLVYVPTTIKKLVLKKMATMGKNTVTDLPNVEEIVIANGTTLLESYAIEKCLNLKTVVVPNDTELQENAIYNCGNKWKIVRMESTGIHHVKM